MHPVRLAEGVPLLEGANASPGTMGVKLHLLPSIYNCGRLLPFSGTVHLGVLACSSQPTAVELRNSAPVNSTVVEI